VAPLPAAVVGRVLIRDASGQALAYVYFEDEDGRRKVMHRLTRNEVRRIAANIAKLPGCSHEISDVAARLAAAAAGHRLVSGG
jgi:hypothetical protein